MPKVYLKKCDVYDCSREVRAVGSKTKLRENDSQKINDTENSKNSRWKLEKILWMYKP